MLSLKSNLEGYKGRAHSGDTDKVYSTNVIVTSHIMLAQSFSLALVCVVSSASAFFAPGTCVRRPWVYNATANSADSVFQAGIASYDKAINATFPVKQTWLLRASLEFGRTAKQLCHADALLTQSYPQCSERPTPSQIPEPCDYTAYEQMIEDIGTSLETANSLRPQLLFTNNTCDECDSLVAVIHEAYLQSIVDLEVLSASLRECASCGSCGRRVY